MKSHVSMEQHVCVACARTYDTGAILLDKRLRQSLERNTVTGWGMCPDCALKRGEGFVALVECDPSKSGITSSSKELPPQAAYRTGRIVHIKREAFERVFNIPMPEKMVCFIEPGVIEALQKIVEQPA